MGCPWLDWLAEDEDLHLKCVFLSLVRGSWLLWLVPGQGGPQLPGCYRQFKWHFLASTCSASCACGLGQTFVFPPQEELPGESHPWKTGCCASRTCFLQPDPPSPLQNRVL